MDPSDDDGDGDLSDPSLDEIDALPAGQLGATWIGSHVQILKAGVPIAHVPVRRAKQKDNSFIKPQGNTKTAGWMGMLSSCSNGCLRRAAGFHGPDLSCYTGPDGKGGCYCSHFACNQRSGSRAAT